MKELPVLKNCFRCKNKVFEFEANVWGCDSCKSVWTYEGKSWAEVYPQNQVRNLRTLKTT